MTKKKLLKALFVAAITTSLVACSNNSSSDESSITSTTSSSGSSVATALVPADKTDVTANASYTIGYGMGSSIAADKNIKAFSLNNDKIIAGFEDAISAKKPAIPIQDIANNMNTLRDKMQQQINEKAVTSFLSVKDSIYNSDLTPKSDVKNPAVVVYEFFDYQCMYCSKLAPEIEKIMKDNNDVQVVFAEFPIFGQKAPASEYAAEVGTAIYKLYGADAYVKYHNGIFATGEDEGSLKNSTVDNVARQAGADMTKVKKAIQDDKIADHLKATLKMGFDELGIQGTPFLVIAPAKEATAANITIIGGYTDADGVQAAINKAKSAATTVTTSNTDQTDTTQSQENISAVTDEAQVASGSTDQSVQQSQGNGSVEA
ncbi:MULTISPECIES: thioredoxin domain-containing protein [Francisella]|uniref:Disulfide bond formation protein DsbA n=1 Tax=Francisella opportunistica TaxID=2016517 RepID=A0A345JRH1_9GAMM|nr:MULTISPECIES: thioredoxin domain-containing protein [Francisella]APC91646.1 Outer membrane protein [Francisella sp. MA067296]AXH29917.1 disulfide bond formation protein DsbA [Francisella opportunistica]AXH31564.1 disulfide bond formation protein DsbA [Francisella opportunistica]AXH33212.1 disulfide bond formation protein DsbA [Francisella opportunistica]